AKLLPARLRPLGYRSYHSGKWHVDGAVLAGGFDRSYYLEGDGQYFHPSVHKEDDRPLPPVEAGSGYYSTAAVADHAVRHLKDHAVDFKDRPFFQFLAFTAPHFPLQAPADDVAKYKGKYDAGWEAVRAKRVERMNSLGLFKGAASAVEAAVGPPYDFPDALRALGAGEMNRPVPWSTMSDEQRKFQAAKMEIHAAMVDRMDREIGRVFDQLRARDAWNDTVVFFLSDNGASAEIMVRGRGHDPAAVMGSADTYLCLGPGWSTVCNTPLRRHKTWVHEGGIATPLLVHWPAGLKARGELRRTPGHVVDLAPTILALASARPTPPPSDEPPSNGLSLAPTFTDDVALKREFLWWEHGGNKAVRQGDWKLVAAKNGPWELYDLSVDRIESRDLAGEQPDRVRELSTAWQRQYDENAALARRDAPPQPAAAKKKQPVATK
ncbi:MAG: sulfatase-like hydrolase/transferase, partial [Planctomycetia bacterium]